MLITIYIEAEGETQEDAYNSIKDKTVEELNNGDNLEFDE